MAIYKAEREKEGLAQFLRNMIVSNREQVENRRLYLRAMRYQDLAKSAFICNDKTQSLDYDDYLHFEQDFNQLMLSDFQPFRGNFFKVGDLKMLLEEEFRVHGQHVDWFCADLLGI